MIRLRLRLRHCAVASLAIALVACTSNVTTLDPEGLCERVIELERLASGPDAQSVPWKRVRRNCRVNAEALLEDDPRRYRHVAVCVSRAESFDAIIQRCDGEEHLGQLMM